MNTVEHFESAPATSFCSLTSAGSWVHITRSPTERSSDQDLIGKKRERRGERGRTDAFTSRVMMDRWSSYWSMPLRTAASWASRESRGGGARPIVAVVEGVRVGRRVRGVGSIVWRKSVRGNASGSNQCIYTGLFGQVMHLDRLPLSAGPDSAASPDLTLTSILTDIRTLLRTMGALLSIPILGGLGSLASSAVGGIVFFMSGTAASALFKSCNCNSPSSSSTLASHDQHSTNVLLFL